MRFLLIALLLLAAPAHAIQSTYLTGSATAITQGGTVLGISIQPGDSAGTIEFRSDVGTNPATSGSAVQMTLGTVPVSAGWAGIQWFSQGWEFRGGLYITLDDVDSVTVIWK